MPFLFFASAVFCFLLTIALPLKSASLSFISLYLALFFPQHYGVLLFFIGAGMVEDVFFQNIMGFSSFLCVFFYGLGRYFFEIFVKINNFWIFWLFFTLMSAFFVGIKVFFMTDAYFSFVDILIFALSLSLFPLIHKIGLKISSYVTP